MVAETQELAEVAQLALQGAAREVADVAEEDQSSTVRARGSSAPAQPAHPRFGKFYIGDYFGQPKIIHREPLEASFRSIALSNASFRSMCYHRISPGLVQFGAGTVGCSVDFFC